jgi:endonuclease YncB( thermonuclease family)
MKRLPVQTPAMARKFLLGVATLVALSWPAVAVAQPASTTIVSIGDGDTIRVRQAGKALTVRLACIDAPETAQGAPTASRPAPTCSSVCRLAAKCRLRSTPPIATVARSPR